jgi:hypothetical protein
MNIKKHMAEIAGTFVIVFVASASVNFLIDFLTQEDPVFDWTTSLSLAIILMIVLPYLRHRGDKET